MIIKRLFIFLIVLIISLLFIRFFLGGDEDIWICDKVRGEWIKHGNPRAPMPKSGCGKETSFTDQDKICTSESGKQMTLQEARGIAQTDCTKGTLKETYSCNPNSGTWWFDFTPNEPKEGCNPACVVFVETGEVEINWRCTGLVEPT